PTRFLGPIKRNKANKSCFRQRPGRSNQFCQRKSRPWDYHGPGLDATMPVDSLFQGKCPHQSILVVGLRIRDKSGHLQLPRNWLERLDVAPDLLGLAELIEVA